MLGHTRLNLGNNGWLGHGRTQLAEQTKAPGRSTAHLQQGVALVVPATELVKVKFKVLLKRNEDGVVLARKVGVVRQKVDDGRHGVFRQAVVAAYDDRGSGAA